MLASEQVRQNITGRELRVPGLAVEMSVYSHFERLPALAYSLLPLNNHFCQYKGAGCDVGQARPREH